MKLILAVVPSDISDAIITSLLNAQCRVTLISSTGGFLRKGNSTLVVGVESERVESVVQELECVCASELPRGNAEACATVFVLDVEKHMRV